jgi:carbon monoxide dehydrogenase subunit G
MIEFSGERWVEARCEQVWMVIEEPSCRARWLSFNDQIGEVIVSEPSRMKSWNTLDHPTVTIESNASLTVELIPEGAGTRVRIHAAREPAGRLHGIAIRMTTQRVFERNIRRSLDRLAQLLAGRPAG